ncbi:right-handed parallel beta-helix repeat-containing protein [Frigoribacterium sp. CFBP 13707]|uniref:right-handed parallel beta-helix repeat-containing protein n=1 Tax=Frigoribacterium sp. CFBP 13707 TaxID=2775313 RepID=UPI001783EF1B|nr:right-handed parallel beta-helix repeat-containing protein [Frigoribacterium sp. CFBP 13707]
MSDVRVDDVRRGHGVTPDTAPDDMSGPVDLRGSADTGGRLGRRAMLAAALGTLGAGVLASSPVGRGDAAHAVGEPTAPATGAPGAAGTATPGAPSGVRRSSASATLAAAIAGTEAHGTLVVDRSETTAVPVVVDRPMTLLFEAGVELRTTRDVSALVVRADDVTLRGATVVGSGSATSGKARGVEVVATVGAPVRRLRVSGCSISRFSYGAVYLEHVRDFTVDGNVLTDLAYAGVMLFSCLDGTVRGNEVTGVHQSGSFPNSYGIAVNRYWNQSIDVAPRSERITVADNVVSDVPLWEGIDTHGGREVTIVGNRLTGCAVGIAVVPCKSPDGATTYAPLDCVVASNTVDAGTLAVPRNGIVFKGAGFGSGTAVEEGTGAILDNTVTGYGGDTLDAAVCVYFTSGLVVARSVLNGSIARALNIYTGNHDLTVVDTLVTGLTSRTTQRPSVIDVRHHDNSALIVRTRYVATPGSRADAVGLYAAVGGSTLDLVDNDWTATARAVYCSVENTLARLHDGA